MSQTYIAPPAPPSPEQRSFPPEGMPPGPPPAWCGWPPPWYGAAPAHASPSPMLPEIPGGVRKLTYSVNEAAEALGVCRQTVYDLIHSSSFPALKVGGRWKISAELLAEWVRAQAGGGGP